MNKVKWFKKGIFSVMLSCHSNYQQNPHTCESLWRESWHFVPIHLNINMFTSDAQWDWDLLAKTGIQKLGPVSTVTEGNPHEGAVLALQRAVLSFCVIRHCLLLAGRTRSPCKRDSAFHFVQDFNIVGFITFLLAFL